ncbi:MAG: hypothetical protein EA426_10270 [Spirochaetaceae bacterium]|nr:MAG: hypothetical protein EA426_10270 [Spirochaetaceae bacterium]
MTPNVRMIRSQESFVLENSDVSVAVTRRGGMMAPVTFDRASKAPIDPYYISPWQDEALRIDEPVLVPLRGDFFCMPFGKAGTVRGETYAVHGEPAGREWDGVDITREGGISRLTMKIANRARPGTVTKTLEIVEGENVVYSRHEISGMGGQMTLGHHATLRAGENSGALAVSTGPIAFGMTDPGVGPPYESGEYHALPAGVKFSSLKKVPTNWKSEPSTDCTVFPNRRGFVDIIAVAAKARKNQPSWSAAVFLDEGFLWFGLRNPALLPLTVIWMENHGRYQTPWNARTCCIGIEDVCAFFTEGLGPSSKKNALNENGVPTTVSLHKKKSTVVPYVQGVVRTPAGFDRVASATFTNGVARFVSESGKTAEAPVRSDFVFTGVL